MSAASAKLADPAVSLPRATGSAPMPDGPSALSGAGGPSVPPGYVMHWSETVGELRNYADHRERMSNAAAHAVARRVLTDDGRDTAWFADQAIRCESDARDARATARDLTDAAIV